MRKRASLSGLVGSVNDLRRIGRNESRATRLDALRSYARVQNRVRIERSGRARGGEVAIFGSDVRYLHADSLLFMVKEIYVDRTYEFASRESNPTIIDAGANIGLATLFFKQKYPDAHIVAFEPEVHSFAALERNVAANHLGAVTTVRKALAAEAGTCDMAGWPGSLLSSLMPERHKSAEHAIVETAPLSTYIGDRLDFLKLDIEGMENEVIDELATTGKLAVIKRLVCEYHHHMKNPHDRLGHVLQTLEASGFGYQLHAPSRTPIKEKVLQNILIFAYNKHMDDAERT